MDAMKAVELLIEKIKRDYPNDIAFVVVMGSRIYHDTHAKSDVDLFYVAKTKRGENLAQVFILDEIGFDIWCVPWERLERMAEYEESKTSIVAEGQLLYVGSEEDREKFERLRAKALDTSDRWGFVCKARKQFQAVYEPYFRLMQTEDLHEARMNAFGVLYPLTWSIALLNRDMVRRGRAKLKGELLKMPLLPKNFSDLYDVVFQTKDIKELRAAYTELISNMDRLISVQEEQLRPHTPFREKLAELYEEMINFYHKIDHYCETGEYTGALFAAVELTQEFDEAFLGTEVSSKELPDIVEIFDQQNIEPFLQAVKTHHQILLEILREKKVFIREFQDLGEVECFLRAL